MDHHGLLAEPHLGWLSCRRTRPCIAVAAKSRVFVYENLKDGGLDINKRVYQLDRFIDDSDFVGKVASWYQWFRHSFLHNLAQA